MSINNNEKKQNGKGSKRRPRFVSYKTFSENWIRIFGKKNTTIKIQENKFKQ